MSASIELSSVRVLLESRHYLGATTRGFAYRTTFGVVVLAPPTSRRLPGDRWLELTRWCLSGEKDGGSRQWARVWRWLREVRPHITTVVSYSDPAVGHTGALYRACNWLWAPTWHRLRPPPTGQGSWDGRTPAGVKDRWVWCLAPDAEREALLIANDAAVQAKYPWAMYREPRFRGVSRSPAPAVVITAAGRQKDDRTVPAKPYPPQHLSASSVDLLTDCGKLWFGKYAKGVQEKRGDGLMLGAAFDGAVEWALRRRWEGQWVTASSSRSGSPPSGTRGWPAPARSTGARADRRARSTTG